MNLVYDRTVEDVERALALAKKAEAGTLTDAEKNEWLAGMKGCYNASDMNRVEAAVKSIAAELNAAGYAVEVVPVLKGGSRLPSGYTELEYIESSGTQYINTGFKPSGKSRIIMDCAPTSLSSTFCFYCSRTAASATASDTNTLFFYSNAYRGDYYGASSSTSGCYSANARFAIDNNQGMIYIGDNYIISNTTTSISSPMPWILMASAIASGSAIDTSSLGNYASMKLYSCKIYNADTLVRDFIPCKNPSGAVGLYDTVNGTFYGNSGTGVFTAGAEIGALEDREWRESDIIRLSQWRQYLANVQALRDAYYTLAETGQLPAPEDKLGYVGANTIEKVLADIDLLLDGMKSIYRRAGTFSAGGNYIRQIIRSI